MILGNKCDMEDSRVVPRERGDLVSNMSFSTNAYKLWCWQLIEQLFSLTYRKLFLLLY